MKKTAIFIFIFISSFSLSSQNNKFGHVSPEEIMELLPGFDTAKNAMSSYQAELQAEGQQMVKEFQSKQEQYQSQVNTYSASVKKIKADELTAMYARIQEFSSSMEDNLNQKKYDLLLPFQNKIIAAIKEVAQEEHYIYIFNKSILSYSDQSEDISDKVKKKLGL